MNNIVNFGSSQMQELAKHFEEMESMQKAWLAGTDYNPLSMTGSQAGRPESLDPQFISLTHKAEDCRLWQAIPKKRVDSPVLQYARRTSIAQAITYSEGGDVGNISDKFDRQLDTVKFIGVKGEVSGVSQETKFIVDAVTEETNNKIKALMRGLDLLLWHGDGSLNTLEFDSIRNQVKRKCKNASVQVLDKRGKRLSFKDIIKGNTVITKEWGNVSGRQAWTSIEALNSLILDELENKTYFTNNPGNINLKRVIEEGFELGIGKGTFQYDVFASPIEPARSINGAPILNDAGTAFASNHAQAPTAVSAVTPTAVATDTAYAIPSGTYNYAVTAFNRFGESAAVEASVTVLGSGNKVSFATFAESSAVSGQEAVGFRIYRRNGSQTDVNDYRLVKTVSTSASQHYDDNQYIPGTSHLCLIDWDMDEVLRFCQQMPLYKLPYGIRKDAVEFLIKLYGTMQVRNANKIYIIENIGDLPNTD